MKNALEHYGTPRHSGRYPWGSGDNPYQRTGDFLSAVRDFEKQGIPEKEIAQMMGMTIRQMRARKTAANEALRADMVCQAQRLKEKGYSNTKIGEMLGGISEGKVRSLLKPAEQEKEQIIKNVADALRQGMKEHMFLDVGVNMGAYLGVSDTKLNSAVQLLKDEEGYVTYSLKVDQLGTDYKTTYQVLCPPGTTFKDLIDNRFNEETQQPNIGYLTGVKLKDGGATSIQFDPPQPISSDRVDVRFGDEGGAQMDGVILVRRGVDDVSLGQSRYAQVRILVDDDKYMKGMAVYADDKDLPNGVDLLFNTNKTRADCDGEKKKAMKDIDKNDPDNPFKAIPVDQHGVMNMVNMEGDWGEWKKSLASQMLSKQPVALAKRQLNIDYENKLGEFNEIMEVTNPTVRQQLLMEYASNCDSAAVHLKAAAMPRQASHVILPFPDMKENEIYAPNYENGETVVLIRYPHGGKFEIPTLTVNNKFKKAKDTLGNAPDAVGINSKVAERLSGADFDGDSVLVIPNNEGRIKTRPALDGLKDFDPKITYKKYDGMTEVGPKTDGFRKGVEMGKVSNLITDMTIKGADWDEIAAAVRHSMVVIDAEKHQLNWKQSEIDNNILHLKEKYQGSERAGASTLISKSTSEERVPLRKQYTKIDKETGKLIYEETGAKYYNPKTGKMVPRTQKSTKMTEVDDAFKLSSGTQMENVYANYANQMKALANQARKEAVTPSSYKYDPSARKVYAKEVASLEDQLRVAKSNAPKERQAQLLGNMIVASKKRSNPDMDHEELSKVKGKALITARKRVGAKKTRINITDREWTAIQAGAVTNSFLKEIMRHTDKDRLKQLATPRTTSGLSATQLSRAKALIRNGYTQAEVANQLGVSASTVSKALNA